LLRSDFFVIAAVVAAITVVIIVEFPWQEFTDREGIIIVNQPAGIDDSKLVYDLKGATSGPATNCWLLDQFKKEKADTTEENSQVLEAIFPKTGCSFLEKHKNWVEKNSSAWQTEDTETLLSHWFFRAINPDVKSEDPDGKSESAIVGLYSNEDECRVNLNSAVKDGLFVDRCQLASNSSYLSCIISEGKAVFECQMDRVTEKLGLTQ